MKLLRWNILPTLLVLMALAVEAGAQEKEPHIGYAYPAGACRDTTIQITLGGQYLDGVDAVYFTGEGVTAEVIEHIQPLSGKHRNQLREKLQALRKEQKEGKIKLAEIASKFNDYSKSLGLKDMDLNAFIEYNRKLNDPKVQLNPQIQEQVIVKVTLSADAEPGLRELRLRTTRGITNPQFFRVGRYPQKNEREPNDKAPNLLDDDALPVVLNGQIMPGDVDRFRFTAKKGMRLVAAVEAQRLIPYLADAVPGWFQATLTLLDANGQEVAFCDDFRFHPDPALMYEVPEDGQYELEIRDSIYRGREDFVYRITLGEVPFVTSVFPLGGRAGAAQTVQVTGWNLPTDRMKLNPGKREPGIWSIGLGGKHGMAQQIEFALAELPECNEKEPNNKTDNAQTVQLPIVINGRIDQAGDWDVYRFQGKAGERIVAQVRARRLGSPMDSLLKLTDAQGKPIAFNDDHADKSAGLTTHQADSFLQTTLPKAGVYCLHVGDTQNHGGPEFGYRLRLSAPRPDFQLRVAPATINALAGRTVPIHVHALRSDGFDGPIILQLKDMPEGFHLSGGRIPPGRDHVLATLTMPPRPFREPVRLSMEGLAQAGWQKLRHDAVPAEDMMQAFLYRHLVPMEEGLVVVSGRKRGGASQVRVLTREPVVLPKGGQASVQFATPNGPFRDQLEFELSDPPEGISIGKVSSDPKGVVVLLKVDRDKVQPGLQGNLIASVFLNKQIKDKDGKVIRQQRIPLGVLPAIQFRVAGVPTAKAGSS